MVSGAGWYRYDKPGGKQAYVDEEVTQIVVNYRKAFNIQPRPISSQVTCT